MSVKTSQLNETALVIVELTKRLGANGLHSLDQQRRWTERKAIYFGIGNADRQKSYSPMNSQRTIPAQWNIHQN